VTVNLKRAEGLEIVRRLVRTADVLVENYVPRKFVTMGLSWKDCRALDVRLIYASITGAWAPPRIADGRPSRRLRTDGPVSGGTQVRRRHRGGGGPHAHVPRSLCFSSSSSSSRALADWRPRTTYSTGEPDGPLCKVGVTATDIVTGLYAHGVIMAALLSRQQTGRGVWIDCNMFESQVRARARSFVPGGLS